MDKPEPRPGWTVVCKAVGSLMMMGGALGAAASAYDRVLMEAVGWHSRWAPSSSS
jgi:hypothetical protein